MGTNYYLRTDICEHCGRGDEDRHIGKSSAGWCFALHVYPDEQICSLEDWQREWSRKNAVIVDEYGRVVTPEDMYRNIALRSWNGVPQNNRQWFEDNDAVSGPNNLVRSKLDGRHCIGHGPGTWDLIVGEFS